MRRFDSEASLDCISRLSVVQLISDKRFRYSINLGSCLPWQIIPNLDSANYADLRPNPIRPARALPNNQTAPGTGTAAGDELKFATQA